jgi:hypothetical protein
MCCSSCDIYVYRQVRYIYIADHVHDINSDVARISTLHVSSLLHRISTRLPKSAINAQIVKPCPKARTWLFQGKPRRFAPATWPGTCPRSRGSVLEAAVGLLFRRGSPHRMRLLSLRSARSLPGWSLSGAPWAGNAVLPCAATAPRYLLMMIADVQKCRAERSSMRLVRLQPPGATRGASSPEALPGRRRIPVVVVHDQCASIPASILAEQTAPAVAGHFICA